MTSEQFHLTIRKTGFLWIAMSKPVATLLAYGTGGLPELRDHLPDNAICFGLLRVTLGRGKLSKDKYIFIHWIGSRVSVMLRAKSLTLGDHALQVQALVGGSHADLQASTLDDLSDQRLLDKLRRVIQVDKEVDYSLDSSIFEVKRPPACAHHNPEGMPRSVENEEVSRHRFALALLASCVACVCASARVLCHVCVSSFICVLWVMCAYCVSFTRMCVMSCVRVCRAGRQR